MPMKQKQKKSKVKVGTPRKTTPMKQKQKNSSKSYRCNLAGVAKYVRGLNLEVTHTDELKKTPFWSFFSAIIENKFPLNQCRKNDKLIAKIIEAYDPTTQKFKLGGEKVELTGTDISRIFGISSGKEVLSMKYATRGSVKMVARRKLKYARLTPCHVKKLLTKYLAGQKPDDIMDVVRLLCLYVCFSLFFPHPNATTIPWVHLKRVDDLVKAMTYDWCSAIANHLMTSINKYYQQPMLVSGCVVALQYWLCYHTNVVEASNPDTSLEFIKWDLPLLDDQVQLTTDDDGKRLILLKGDKQVVPQLELNDSPVGSRLETRKQGKTERNQDIDDWLLKHLFYELTDEDEKELKLKNGKINAEAEALLDSCQISNVLVHDYITMLRPVMQQCHFYSPFTVTKILDGQEVGADNISPETHKIFFPVVQYKHWTLLVVDCRKRIFFYLDSLNPDANAPEKLAKWVNQNIKLEKIADKDWDMTFNELKLECRPDIPLQKDVYNCAIYMIAYMVSLAVGDDIPTFTQEQPFKMRRRIYVELRMESLLPPFPGTNYQLLFEKKRHDFNELWSEHERLKSELPKKPESNVKILHQDKGTQTSVEAIEKPELISPLLDVVNSTSDCFPQASTHPPTSSGKKLVVLDVNGLLAYIGKQEQRYGLHPRGGRFHMEVVRRPFCDEFLKLCFKEFKVAVWSSRIKANLDKALVDVMGDLRKELLFCWDQSQCTDTGLKAVENKEKPLFLKELKRIWNLEDPSLSEMGEYNKSNTLLLDDSPYKAYLNPECTAIFPQSFNPDQTDVTDQYLRPGGDLWKYVEGLAACEDVQAYVRLHPFGKRPEEDENWKLLANSQKMKKKQNEEEEEEEKEKKEDEENGRRKRKAETRGDRVESC